MAKRISQNALDKQKARTKLEMMILEAATDTKMTNLELLYALVATQQGILKYMLQAERQGDDE